MTKPFRTHLRLHSALRAASCVAILGLTMLSMPAFAGQTEAEAAIARADAVESILSAGGMSTDRISTVGSGLNKPVATNETVAGRQSNRRVEITLLKQPGL